ncbi:MAG TPA: metalloregulator ArsR/SmtB family transcription factor [Noviherbaspirillum sp.]|uniref:ArsR/SmtB family transcription factor n=1 Tax=Noviherbaspirillum sp. TaxID=1926288 RepID=UPI002B46F3AC|nr:metalloregulator ArsR/SmtB family transcription factor [Noviherbaspirillum sp.]HJV86748.1 metalloregulator ArsR/SmtB family transcription factor [Noviherbaspirillum sp.]
MKRTSDRLGDMQPSLQQMPDDHHLEMVSFYFAVLSEPTRLKILTALRHGERTVNELAAEIEAKQSNVSHKLKMLHQSRILVRRKEGTQVYYRIGDEATMTLCREVCRVQAIVMRRARGEVHDTCRLPDQRCSISGGTCHWQDAHPLAVHDSTQGAD